MKLRFMLLCCITLTGTAYAQNNADTSRVALLRKLPLISAQNINFSSAQRNNPATLLQAKKDTDTNRPKNKKAGTAEATDIKPHKPVTGITPTALPRKGLK